MPDTEEAQKMREELAATQAELVRYRAHLAQTKVLVTRIEKTSRTIDAMNIPHPFFTALGREVEELEKHLRVLG